MPRFVILRHDPGSASDRGVHWDLMLEDGEQLLTWALDVEPVINQPITAQLLPAHRTEYLTYEGPVSGDRGEVQRWDAGSFEWRERSWQALEIAVIGDIVRGVVMLQPTELDPQRWVVSFSEAGGSGM